MEELVTLQYRNFTILWERAREFAQRPGCSNRVTNWTFRGQLFLNELWQEHLGWSTAHKQVWGLFLLEHMLHSTASMRRKEWQRHSQALQVAKVMAPEHPPICTLLGSMDAELLKIAKQVYLGECIVVFSVLPHQWHDECIRELCQELAKCMTRAGLQGKLRPARPTARGGRCSCSHYASWAWSPSAGTQGQSQPSNQEKTPRQTIRVKKAMFLL